MCVRGYERDPCTGPERQIKVVCVSRVEGKLIGLNDRKNHVFPH